MSFVAGSDGKTYDTFLDCYKGPISTQLNSGSGGSTDSEDVKKAKEAAKEIFESGLTEVLESLETSLDCASICKTPLFYLSRSVKDGPPTQDCIVPIMEKFNQPLICIIAFITGLILLGAGVASIPLCTGFKDGEDMMGEP